MDVETEEDQVNIQDLQAQIDLSMSFAQSLASSWIKPRRNAASSSSRRKELESEVWEAAKRPSRYDLVSVAGFIRSNCSTLVPQGLVSALLFLRSLNIPLGKLRD